MITGGAGFIGSNVADLIAEKGHEILIVDNLSSGKKENINPDYRFFHLDILDKEFCQLITEEKPDVISHHAAHIDVRNSVSDPVFNANQNIIATINMCLAASQAKVKKITFASTGGAIYGEQYFFPATEEHRIAPTSPYGLSKYGGELYLDYFFRMHGLPYVALRYANVFGPRQDPLGEAGVVAIFINKLLNSEEAKITGDGTQTRDFVFVKDVALANLKAIESNFCGCLNVGSGHETSINKLFDNLTKLTGRSQAKKYREMPPGEQKRSVITFNKALLEIGWKPQTDLSNGLEETVNFFKNRQING